jgi:hypothetical protein
MRSGDISNFVNTKLALRKLATSFVIFLSGLQVDEKMRDYLLKDAAVFEVRGYTDPQSQEILSAISSVNTQPSAF